MRELALPQYVHWVGKNPFPWVEDPLRMDQHPLFSPNSSIFGSCLTQALEAATVGTALWAIRFKYEGTGSSSVRALGRKKPISLGGGPPSNGPTPPFFT